MNYSIADISTKLAERTEDVCRLLLPQGKQRGDKWEVGGTDGSEGMSCKVQLVGDHKGKWKDWANETERGDLIDLWQAVRGTSRVETMRQVKDYLGIHDAVQQARVVSYAKPVESDKIKQIADNGKVMLYLTGERKLEPAIINRFKVQGDGENIIFPSYDIHGMLVNRSYVKLERVNGKKVVWQEKGCAPALWGWHGLDDAVLTSRKILLCEGQIDCMTWTQWGVAALSIPNGTGNSWIDYEWENLELFDEIFISFDMDGAGKDNGKKVMQRLGLHRCRIVKLPHKDANAALQNGMSGAEAMALVAVADYPSYEGLSPAVNYYDDTFEQFFPNPDKPQGFKPEMMQRYDGGVEFLPGDVTIWSGVTSHGKTSVLNYLAGMLVGPENKKVMIASLEMKPGVLLSRMFKSMLRKEVLTNIDIDTCFSNIEDKLFFADKIGYIGRKELLDMMQFAFSRYGVDHVIIDSLMRIEGLEEDHPAQGDFMNALQAFAKPTGCHVHVVCHPRKTFEERAPGKLDVKGSSMIANNADNLLVIHKNMEKEKIRRERMLTPEEDRSMFDAEVISEKQRINGWVGRVLLTFDRHNFRFSKFLGIGL